MDSRVTTTPYLEAQRAQLGLVWRLLTGPPVLGLLGGQLERPAGAASLARSASFMSASASAGAAACWSLLK